MSAQPTLNSRGRKARLLAALASTALAAATMTATASAAPASGDVVLSLKKGADSSLLREGVKASPRDGGKGGNQTVKLAVADLDLSNGATVGAAALTLSAKGKSAKLNDVVLRLGAKSTTLSAKHGGKRTVFFRVAKAASIDGASAQVKGPLALTGKGAKALRKALGLDGITAGKVGSASVLASATLVIISPPKEEPKVDPYPYASQCPVGAVAGAPGGFGDAPGKVAGTAAAPLFASGTSQSVTGTAIDWGFKASFRGYVLGTGSLQTLDGATANPVGSMAAPGAYFGFPVSGGSYEAGSEPNHSDDLLVSNGTGTVLFCNPAHGFNIVLKNPTVTIDGDDSRITADVGANVNGTWYPFQRTDVADLDLSAITPEVTNSGNTLVWKDVPAKLTADGATATGGLYDAGAVLDKVTVKTSLDRPLTAECAITAGNPAPEPVVTFGLAELPTLTDPVEGAGGTINWGFRRAFRATVKTNGGFTMLGGATESYPGNMGGAAEPAPLGGEGKFFRFPIDRYAYDEGAAGGADDILIATSEASVGFCNPTHGYAALISKPMLVIAGADSRLTANVYSFQKTKGWIGGRVDLVDLNSTGIDAVVGGGTVSWGQVLANDTPMTAGIPVDGGFLTEALKLAAMSLGGSTGTFDPVAAQITLPTP